MASNRIIWIALVVSTLLHLSMVTVFKVYINLPAQNPSGNATRIRYASLDLVNPEGEPVLLASNSTLQLRPLKDVIDATTASGLNATRPPLDLPTPKLEDTSLPPINFPTLELAELRLLQARERGARLQEQPGEENEKVDAWGWLVRSIGSFQHRLQPWTPFELPVQIVPETPREPVNRPVPGVALYIDWMNGPKKRDIVFSAPIDALWKIDAKTLKDPISLVITVSALGDVTKVVTPVNDENGIVASAAKAILKYKFAALDDPIAGDQYGTVEISQDPDATP